HSAHRCLRIGSSSRLRAPTLTSGPTVFARELVIVRLLCKLGYLITDLQRCGEGLAGVRGDEVSRIEAMDTPKFPHHLDCEALTGLTLDHLPRDGSLGRSRRYAKGTHLWDPDDAADRIYFLRRGRVAI